MYQEDVDLSFRLRLAGGRLGVEPAAVVDHDYAFARARRSGGCSSATAGRRSCAATRGHCSCCWPRRWLPPRSRCSSSRRRAAGCRRSSLPPRETLRALPRLLRERRTVQAGRGRSRPPSSRRWLTPGSRIRRSSAGRPPGPAALGAAGVLARGAGGAALILGRRAPDRAREQQRRPDDDRQRQDQVHERRDPAGAEQRGAVGDVSGDSASSDRSPAPQGEREVDRVGSPVSVAAVGGDATPAWPMTGTGRAPSLTRHTVSGASRRHAADGDHVLALVARGRSRRSPARAGRTRPRASRRREPRRARAGPGPRACRAGSRRGRTRRRRGAGSAPGTRASRAAAWPPGRAGLTPIEYTRLGSLCEADGDERRRRRPRRRQRRRSRRYA